MDDAGTDIAAIDTLPDPEVLVSGDANVAYAQARRLVTPLGALEDIGDPAIYDSTDVTEFLAARVSAADRAQLEREVIAVLNQEERARRVDASVSFAGGELSVESETETARGTFASTFTIDQAGSARLRVL